MWVTNDVDRYSMVLDSVNFYLKLSTPLISGQRNGIQFKKQCFKKNRLVRKTKC